jgi:hypothetical protein
MKLAPRMVVLFAAGVVMFLGIHLIHIEWHITQLGGVKTNPL